MSIHLVENMTSACLMGSVLMRSQPMSVGDSSFWTIERTPSYLAMAWSNLSMSRYVASAVDLTASSQNSLKNVARSVFQRYECSSNVPRSALSSPSLACSVSSSTASSRQMSESVCISRMYVPSMSSRRKSVATCMKRADPAVDEVAQALAVVLADDGVELDVGAREVELDLEHRLAPVRQDLRRVDLGAPGPTVVTLSG